MGGAAGAAWSVKHCLLDLTPCTRNCILPLMLQDSNQGITMQNIRACINGRSCGSSGNNCLGAKRERTNAQKGAGSSDAGAT